MQVRIAGVLAMVAMAGCPGGSDSKDPDAAPADARIDGPPPIDAPPPPVCAGPDLLVAADPVGGTSQSLVISEINPGEYIEVYNNTTAPMDLGNTDFWLCSPFNYLPIGGISGIGNGSIIPAKGYAVLPWPLSFNDEDAGGEVILYGSSDFDNDTAIMDFVCWGANPHSSRKGQAENPAHRKWNGACAGALTMGALTRLPSTDGIDAADYSVTAAPSRACP